MNQVLEALRDRRDINVNNWYNIYRVFDYVGGRISTGSKEGDGIREFRVSPMFQWPLGHANYWGDRRVQQFYLTHILERKN
jgi:hypothetical protein